MRLAGFHFGVSSDCDWYWIKPSHLFLYSTTGATSVSPRMRGLLQVGAHECRRGTHLFSPDGQLRSAVPNQCCNQLVAIFDYNTWAAFAPQADREEPAGARGRCSSRPSDELWLKSDGWTCLLLIFSHLCKIWQNFELSNEVWKTDLKTAGSPLELSTTAICIS